MDDYTNGAPFLVTQVEDLGEFSRRIHYLFPNGSRRGFVIEQAKDSPELREKLALGWLKARSELQARYSGICPG